MKVAREKRWPPSSQASSSRDLTGPPQWPEGLTTLPLNSDPAGLYTSDYFDFSRNLNNYYLLIGTSKRVSPKASVDWADLQQQRESVSPSKLSLWERKNRDMVLWDPNASSSETILISVRISSILWSRFTRIIKEVSTQGSWGLKVRHGAVQQLKLLCVAQTWPCRGVQGTLL